MSRYVSSRRLRRDERGVSEVLSYLFSFLMSVMILVTSLYAFGQINKAARTLGAQSEVKDIVNRVALGVQETLQVGAARVESAGTADAATLSYERVIGVPAEVQGMAYTVSLDQNFVNGTIPETGARVSVSTFNAAVSLPPNPGACAATYAVCSLGGSNGGNKAQIVVLYQFISGSPPTNAITIS